MQQELAKSAEVIMDGRDIGTCVLPQANVKVYLTADAKVRAKRRFDELTAKGEACDIDKIETDIIDRDYRDMNRETSPLKKADDEIDIVDFIQVLKNKKMYKTVAVVTRYFGGVKLGTGGLVRAYQDSVLVQKKYNRQVIASNLTGGC